MSYYSEVEGSIELNTEVKELLDLIPGDTIKEKKKMLVSAMEFQCNWCLHVLKKEQCAAKAETCIWLKSVEKAKT